MYNGVTGGVLSAPHYYRLHFSQIGRETWVPIPCWVNEETRVPIPCWVNEETRVPIPWWVNEETRVPIPCWVNREFLSFDTSGERSNASATAPP